MKTGRFLFAVFILMSCCLSAQAFQAIKPTPPRTPAAAEDELERHRGAAETYQLSGDLENARLENQKVVSIALVRLANTSIRQGQLKRASEILLESVAVHDSSDARAGLAVVFMQLGDLDDGLANARIAIELDPKNGEAQDALGKLLYLKEDYSAALPVLERMVGIKPGFDSAYTLGMTYLQLKQLDRAKLLFEEMLTAVKKKAPLHVILGKALEATNYPIEAEREFRSAVKADPNLPGVYFYLGFTILQNGGSARLEEAGREFDLELKLSPRDPYPNFLAGVVASSMGDHPKAIRFLQNAVRFDNAFGPAHLFLGQSQIEFGQDALAEKSLRKAIELSDDPSKNGFQIRRAYFLLGRLLNRLGRAAEGEKHLAKARELQGQMLDSARDDIRKVLGEAVDPTKLPASPGAVSRSGTTAATLNAADAAALKRLRNRLSSIVAEGYHNLAVIETQNGRPEESLAKFAAAAAWQPDLPGLDRNWGIVSFKANRFDKAVLPLSRHLKTKPDDTLVRRMLGVSHFFTKNYKQAADVLKPIEAGLAADPELAYFYGVSLVQVQRHPEASIVFGRISSQNPMSAQAQFYAGQGFVLAGDLGRAVTSFRQAASVDPKIEMAHYNAGQSLIRMNRLDEAETEFRQELRLNPSNAFAKYHLAYTLIERKAGIDEAVKLLREAIDSKYDYADARYQLGKVLIERGSIDEALQQLETAAAIDPKKDYIQYQLSIAYRKASRIADAERALKLYSDLKAENRGGDPAGIGNKKNEP